MTTYASTNSVATPIQSNTMQDRSTDPPGGEYPGGFSSSLCDGLFEENDKVHSDCCALTCCGILLYDRNAYLLTDGEQRPSWKNRCCSALVYCLVLAAFILVGLFRIYVEHSLMVNDDNTDDNDDEPQSSKSAPEDFSSVEEALKLARTLRKADSILFGMVAGLTFYFLCVAARHRFQLRRLLTCRMYQDRRPFVEHDTDDRETDDVVATTTTPLMGQPSADVQKYLQQEEPAMASSTGICGCIRVDNPSANHSNSAADHSHGASDMCHWMWRALAAMCCGACCGCWCQCCGLCAMAQEDRELHRILPKEKFQIDFITFQPFEEYFPKLQYLRENKINNPFAHITELSLLSKHLIRIVLVVLGILTVLALTGLDPFFQPIHLLVVGMVFLQSFVIIYFVHWQWNRFDLSFDAIVKFFASGFILGTTNALVYETMVSTMLTVGGTLVRYAVAFFMILTGQLDDMDDDATEVTSRPFSGTVDNGMEAAGAEDGSDGSVIIMLPVWVLFLEAFLNAFVVAAMVEELTKYFGYWMVEHPDLIVPEKDDNNNSSQAGIATASRTVQPSRKLTSLGAGVTIAMVTTAMGFACCENFLYVFFYSRPAGASTEISTLIARSFFPVHPLAAAIQSIGVCRRDLEKDHTVGLGRILLPALLLHGSFDFALMFLNLLQSRSPEPDDPSSEDESGHAGTRPVPSVDEADQSLGQALPALACCVSIVTIGVIYFVCKSLAQRKRLEELDKKKRKPNTREYENLR